MSTDRTFNQSITRNSVPLTYIDPLAQTFIIEESCILTKIELFFKEKDDNLPVKIEIRRVTNGVPNNLILPFSEINIDAANVNVSANSLIASTATFSNPVYVEPGEYALCISSESSKTKIWISQMGEADVSNGLIIQKQPNLGVLFKSRNSTVWVPDQLQDLKFNLYRAKFTPGQTATVVLHLYDTTTYSKLPADPLEIYPQITTMKVYHPDHGLKNGSSVSISPIIYTPFANITYFGLYPANITGKTQVVSNVTLDSYTVNMDYAANSDVKGVTRFGGSHLSAASDFKYSDIFSTVQIKKPADSTIVHSIKSTDTNYVEDTNFTVITPDKDFNFDTVRVLPSTTNRVISMNNFKSFLYKLEIVPNNLYDAPIVDMEKSGIIFFNNKINNPSYDTEHVIAAEIRTITTGNTTSFTKLSTTTGTVNISNTNARTNAVSIVKGTTLKIFGSSINSSNVRVIDILNSGANILVSGNITTETANGSASSNVVIYSGSKFIAEEAATGGTASAKYITRQLNFINPSSAFKIFIDVAKPPDTYLKFYFRTSLVGDTSALSEKEYTEITEITIKDSLGEEFYEIEKLVDNLENFDGLQLKIVFLSDNIAKVPRCRNLRIVAIA
jgi:hypothetical protein